MRDMGVRGLRVYCSDYHCSHSLAIRARKALRPFGVNISTVYGGGGFSMDELSRARFKAVLTQRLKGMFERLEPQPREIA
jgi:hypothetical protein